MSLIVHARSCAAGRRILTLGPGGVAKIFDVRAEELTLAVKMRNAILVRTEAALRAGDSLVYSSVYAEPRRRSS